MQPYHIHHLEEFRINIQNPKKKEKNVLLSSLKMLIITDYDRCILVIELDLL